MKKQLLTIVSLGCIGTFTQAQINTPNGTVGTTANPTTGNIGIGTNNPQTKLEISSGVYNDSGLKFTNLTSNNASIVRNAKFLGVDDQGKVVLAENSGNLWKLSGNGGTREVNFIGTTDDQPLIFKTNNTEKLRITTNGRFIAFGTPSKFTGINNLFFGSGNDTSLGKFNTVFGLENFTSNIYGTTNTIFGNMILENGTHSSGNTAIGSRVLKDTSSAQSNVGIGDGVMLGPGYFSSNVAVGAGSFFRASMINSGNNDFISIIGNVGVGSGTLTSLKSGDYNTAIGSRSLSNLGRTFSPNDVDLSTHNIGIGYDAGQNLEKGKNNILIGGRVKTSQEITNNELNIGNWIYGIDGDIGIGTQSPQAKFEINGKTDHDSGLRFTKMNSGSPATPNAKLLGVDAEGKVVLAESSGGSGSGWNLTGNAGTDPATNFIGTTDTQPILFKTNNEEQMRISAEGKLGLGTAQFSCTGCSGYRLFVKDGIKTEKVKVNIASANGWADYVFNKDYKLVPLSEVEKYIQEKGHLPNIPSADEVMKEGIDLGAMDAKLLEKIEELTLYSIEQQKKIAEVTLYSIEQQKKIEQLISYSIEQTKNFIEQNKELKELKKEVEHLKNK